MPLIVEDGTIVDDANSYNGLPAIRAYAELRRRVLPDDDDLVIAYAIRGMDYLESFEDQFKGERTFGLDQSLSWPRSDVDLFDDGVILADDFMPQNLLNAHMQLVIEIAAGVELQPTMVMTGRVKRRKTGPLETEWFDAQSSGIAPVIISVDAFLAPLLMRQTFGLRTVRV